MSHFEHGIIYQLDTPPFRDGLLDFMEDEGYRAKDEFHVTIASAAYLQGLTLEQGEKFKEALTHANLPIKYEDVLYCVEKPKQLGSQTFERRSIVTPLRPGALIERVGEIAAKLEIVAPNPFPHVTIATAPDSMVARRGIGIDSATDWIALDPTLYLEGWMKHE